MISLRPKKILFARVLLPLEYKLQPSRINDGGLTSIPVLIPFVPVVLVYAKIQPRKKHQMGSLGMISSSK